MTEWTGIQASTIRDRLCDIGHPSAEFLLRFLGGPPKEYTRRFWAGSAACGRPSTTHVGQATVVGRLKTILGQPTRLRFSRAGHRPARR